MNKTQLAKNLGISRTQLYKLEARGMPTDKGIGACIEWRRQNLDVTQTKNWRMDSNPGVKPELTQINHSDDYERHVISFVLTDVVPKLWFNQPGWLGIVLKDNDVKITAEKLLQVQACLYIIYMSEVSDYLEEDEEELLFHFCEVFKAKPGDEIYPSLMARLSQILN